MQISLSMSLDKLKSSDRFPLYNMQWYERHIQYSVTCTKINLF